MIDIRNYFIIIKPYKKDNNNNNNNNNISLGTSIDIKSFLPNRLFETISGNFIGGISSETILTQSNYYSLPPNSFDMSTNLYRDKIIVSANFSKSNTTDKPCVLITQQNLYHNIKYIHLDNDLSKPRIIFCKYNESNNINNINNNQFLFSNLNNVFINNHYITELNNDQDDLSNNRSNNLKRLNFFYNIYNNFNTNNTNNNSTNNSSTNNSSTNYYQFQFSDFTKSIITTDTDISITNISLNNDFSNINYNYNPFNYDPLNFNTLFYYNNQFNNNILDISYFNIDNSFTELININNNILLYNEFDNITTINYNYNQLPPNNYINFAVIKRKNIIDSSLDPNYGKIYLFGNKRNSSYENIYYIYSSVLGYNNNFYSINNLNTTNKIYLSIGNGNTGITQKNIFNNIAMDINKTENINYYYTNKIYLGNFSNINNNNYLLDNNYNYNYTNILTNYYDASNIKKIQLNLSPLSYISTNYDFSNVITKNQFNNFSIINKDISLNYYIQNFNNNKLNFHINKDDIIFNNSYRLILSKLNTNENIFSNTQEIDVSQITLNFRNNYNSEFNSKLYLTMKYELSQDDEKNNDISFLRQFYNKLIVNFHKITIDSNIKTSRSSGFDNVNCIYIYHDPEDESTDDKFKYPNNNIEIIRNPEIDSLTSAIETLEPGSNSIFIPARNGSNLSRKQIQGMIGLNSIPRLLSIEPYDPNFIVGRGFINQLTISEDFSLSCKTQEEKVIDKVNIFNKKSNNNDNRNINFSNLVRSNKRNRLSQNCINKLQRGETTTQVQLPSANNYYTPLTHRLWKK